MNYRRTKGEKRRMAYDGYKRMSAAVVLQALKDLKKIQNRLNDEFITETEVNRLYEEAAETEDFLRDENNPYIELLRIGYPVIDEGIARILKDESDNE